MTTPTYRQPRVTSFLLLAGLAGTLFVTLLSAGADIVSWMHFHKAGIFSIEKFEDLPRDVLPLTLVLTYSSLWLLQITVYYLVGFLLMIWLVKVLRNAAALKTGVTYTPKWGVLAWLVPVVYLYFPYCIMKELLLSSGPDENWKSAKAPLMVEVWWLMTLFNIIASYIYYYLQSSKPMEWQEFPTRLLCDISMFIAGPILILLILKINKGQLEKWETQTKSTPAPESQPALAT
ncbi:MAG: DUF4328 domain-containing protein [Myxococcales bacterium]|nr:MAG: DUF4328 domain-containing protein [Myxococcales bacterium]